MNFLVRHRGLWKEAQYAMATQADVASLLEWQNSVESTKNPIIRDAMEFVELACQWHSHVERRGCLVCSVEEIREFIQDNPHAQAAVCVVARASWYEHSPILGMCIFRRTWSHNILADFLVVHPLATRSGEDKVSGIGSGLLYIVARIANEIQAGVMWGEATQNSSGFYRKLFGLVETRDLLQLTVEQLAGFVCKMDDKQAAIRRETELMTL